MTSNFIIRFTVSRRPYIRSAADIALMLGGKGVVEDLASVLEVKCCYQTFSKAYVRAQSCRKVMDMKDIDYAFVCTDQNCRNIVDKCVTFS